MVSLFTTKANLEDIFLREDKKAWQEIIYKLNEVFINEDPFSEENVDPDDDIFRTLYGMGVNIRDDEKVFINNIPKNPESVLQYPCGIFLLNITENQASDIQNNYGVICQSVTNLNDAPLTQNHISNELEENQGDISWNSMLNKFKQIPSNSMLVIDAHLFGNDRFDENQNKYDPNRNSGLKNLFDIIDALLPQNFKSEYHIGVLLTDTDKAIAAGRTRTNLSNARISKAIHRLKEGLNRPYKDKLIIEVFFFDARDNDGHKLIHNRRILSNYFIVTADYKLAALRNGRSLADQSITVFPLFENISKDSGTDKKEKRMSSEIRKLKDYFERQTRSVSPTALILQNNRRIDDFKDIKHRLLRSSPMFR